MFPNIKCRILSRRPEEGASIELNAGILEIIALPSLCQSRHIGHENENIMKARPAVIHGLERAMAGSVHPIFETSLCARVPPLPALQIHHNIEANQDSRQACAAHLAFEILNQTLSPFSRSYLASRTPDVIIKLKHKPV
jgi:hypothetical protein